MQHMELLLLVLSSQSFSERSPLLTPEVLSLLVHDLYQNRLPIEIAEVCIPLHLKSLSFSVFPLLALSVQLPFPNVRILSLLIYHEAMQSAHIPAQ